MSPYTKYLTNCGTCGQATTKKFARANDGSCKSCISGINVRATRETGGKMVWIGGERVRGRFCEDAPCCGCCGPGSDDSAYAERDYEYGN